jgi:hypothetical protein
MRRLTAALLLFLSAAPAHALQRQPLPVGPGERVLVRVSVSPEKREGIIVAIDDAVLLLGTHAPGDSLTRQPSRVDTIPLGVLRTLHVYRPIEGNRRMRSALGWGALGAIGGALIGALIGDALFEDSSEDPGLDRLVGGLYGTLAGTAIGLTYGSLRPSPWEAVFLPNTERERR